MRATSVGFLIAAALTLTAFAQPAAPIAGIVFSFAFFDHENINWTWQLAELFKVENGQIRRIEAVFHHAPYGINSGWSTYEEGLSEGAANRPLTRARPISLRRGGLLRLDRA